MKFISPAITAALVSISLIPATQLVSPPQVVAEEPQVFTDPVVSLEDLTVLMEGKKCGKEVNSRADTQMGLGDVCPNTLSGPSQTCQSSQTACESDLKAQCAGCVAPTLTSNICTLEKRRKTHFCRATCRGRCGAALEESSSGTTSIELSDGAL